MTPVSILNIPLPNPNIEEIRRYAKCPSGATKEIEDCISELSLKSGKACYVECDVSYSSEEIDLEFSKTNSKSLFSLLKDCDKIILFAATIGLEPDRLISKYSKISPSKALFFQAISTERIEATCDKLCDILEEKYDKTGFTLTNRFSPGYGDLPLMLQKDIFRVLNCPKNIGVTLNESLLMMPSKSVTAIIGIKNK